MQQVQQMCQPRVHVCMFACVYSLACVIGRVLCRAPGVDPHQHSTARTYTPEQFSELCIHLLGKNTKEASQLM